ncbi:MAG TPA: acyl-CoA dehydrogenase family protein, partial [Chloroflexota bacterium]
MVPGAARLSARTSEPSRRNSTTSADGPCRRGLAYAEGRITRRERRTPLELGLSEEQTLLRDAARELLEKECPESRVRAMESDALGYSPDLWRLMAQQGWMGLLVPERYGGSGMSFLDLLVLVEEFGRVLLPGPALPTQVATLALLEAASDAQKRCYLPAISAGQSIWTLAFTEPSARFDAEGVDLAARANGDGFVLNGTKLFVRDSHVADRLIVVARTGGRAEDGISLFVVDTTSPGIRQTPIRTIASDRQCQVRFENVHVAADALLGDEGGGWPVFQRIANRATVLECAYLVGLCQRAFEITLAYTKQRIQFDRVIATFQALQHQATDMATDMDGARLITTSAAWALHAEEPDQDEEVHVAKAWVSAASQRVVARAQAMHGGIGFTRDYPIQLYFRRQKASELAWGDADHHRELLC